MPPQPAIAGPGWCPTRACARPPRPIPCLRWPWAEVRAALEALATDTSDGSPVQLGYVDPETGNECLPTLGFSALMLRPGEEVGLPRDSASAVFHIVTGAVQCAINDTALDAEEADVLSAPAHARVRLANRSAKAPAFLFRVDDAPLQHKIRIYERFPA
jgi:gentisate 1,2-dioxygenase